MARKPGNIDHDDIGQFRPDRAGHSRPIAFQIIDFEKGFPTGVQQWTRFGRSPVDDSNSGHSS
jgi:hypothetical protein